MMAAPRDDEALYNVEGEAALLGALMWDNKRVDAIADILSPEDFADPLMGRIYSAIVREVALGRSATPVTLHPYLVDDPDITSFGGPGFLAQLTGSSAVQLIHASDQASQIAELAARRRLVASLSKISEDAGRHDVDLAAIIDEADAALFEATGKRDNLHQPTGADCIAEAMAEFNQPRNGVRCGKIDSIDRLLGPMRPKQLIIGAGRPGMGKTACAISYALGAAEQGHGVLFVSLEMSSAELGQRMAADLCFNSHGGVPFAAISSGHISGENARAVARAHGTLAEMPFRVIDAGGLTIGRLSMIVRRYKRRMAALGQKLDLVVVDYLQLLRPDTKMRSTYEAVSEISRGLKEIAKEHEVAVFALAQLSRETEKRTDKRPMLSDLKDSGQIEQDADAVMFLFRPEYYVRQAEPERGTVEHDDWQRLLDKVANRIEFIVAKRRNGRTGHAEGYFHTSYQAVRGDGAGEKPEAML
jgi:replicative DNA helicase